MIASISESTMNDRSLRLSDEEWNRFACHVASIAVQEVRGFAVTAAVVAVSKLSILNTRCCFKN